MDHSKNEPSTPRFGCSKDNTISFKVKPEKKSAKSSKDVSKCIKYKEKIKSKSKFIKSKSKSKEKAKSKSKEKSKNKRKSSNSKKKINYSSSLPVEHKYENPLELFLKKRLKLRNDFDQKNSEKFLSEKELAFEHFKMKHNADELDN